MRKHTPLLLAVLTASLALSGCNRPSDESSNPPSSPDSTPDSSATTPDTPSSSLPSYAFTDEEMGILKGTFNAASGTVTVTNSKLILTDPLTGEEESYPASEVNKTLDSSGNKVNVLSFEDGNYEVLLDTTETGRAYLRLDDNLENTQTYYQPTMEEFGGAYFNDFFLEGIATSGDNTYLFGNTFDYSMGMYTMTTYLPSYETLIRSYFVESYYYAIEDKLVKAISIYDNEDYEYYQLVMSENEDRSVSLKGILDSDGVVFGTTPYFFQNSYYDGANSKTYAVDLDAATITVAGKTYSYAAHYNKSIGSYYELSAEAEKLYIQATPHGLQYMDENLNPTKLEVFEDDYGLIGTFRTSGMKIQFDGEELKINDAVTSYTYKIYHNQKALCFDHAGTTYYLSTFLYATGTNDLVVLNKATDSENNKENVLINEENYASLFTGEFIHFGTSKIEMKIDADMKVTYGGKALDGRLVVDKKSGLISVHFNDGAKLMKVDVLNNSYYTILSVTCDQETSIFIAKEEYDHMIANSYTSHSEIDLTIGEKTLNILGEQKTYSYGYVIYGVYVYLTLELENTDYRIVFADRDYFYTEKAGDENYEPHSFINIDYFPSIVGTYSYEGTYGEESFRMAADGNFYVDYLNANNDGLDKNVLTQYHLTLSRNIMTDKVEVCIAFYYEEKNMTVNAYLRGHSLVVMGINYVDQRLYRSAGIYFDSALTHALTIKGETVTYDGEALAITELASEGDKVLIKTASTEFTVDGATITAKDVETQAEIILNKDTEFNPHDFLGAKTEVDGTTYEVVEFTDIMTGEKKIQVTDGFMNYDYTIIIRDGKKTLKFGGLFVTIYVYMNGDTAVMEVESSLPPVPPLPPAP